MPRRLLFTPGPLTTSRRVKEAMLVDLGSREEVFLHVVAGVRRALLAVAGVSAEAGWEAVLMQGSGTFGLESALGSAIPPHGRALVLVNGAYGERLVEIARRLGIETEVSATSSDRTHDPDDLDRRLAAEPALSHVAMVHCETSTGLINPVEAIGAAVRRHGRVLILDSMSAFGGVPFDLAGAGVDFLVSSPNKCLQGVPGFSFVLCPRAALEAIEGPARSLSLDLAAQWRGLEATGQFRFTPPTHAILALAEALRELDDEGGVEARAARYARNHEVLVTGMRRLGFRTWLPETQPTPIITAFRSPERFDFERFYGSLAKAGFVIYPGKLPGVDCFRIGTIGAIGDRDVEALLDAIEEKLKAES